MTREGVEAKQYPDVGVHDSVLSFVGCLEASSGRTNRGRGVLLRPTRLQLKNLKKYNLSIEVDHRNPPAHQSYRCDGGHIFFVEKAKNSATESQS
jgi:hypothetical protein